MVVNYQLGKIYTVRSLTSSEIYVGSTCMILCKRMTKHRSDWKNGLVLGLHKEIVYDINEWFIELYELFPCNLKCELEKREGEVIRQIGTLNMNIAGRSSKEWRIDNKDKMKDYFKSKYIEKIDKIKEYYINNKDKLTQKNKEWRIDNKDKITQKDKDYYVNNIDKIKERHHNNYLKKKLAKSQPITE